MSGVVRRIVLVCAVLLAAVVPAAAQVSTGEIFGKVTDGTGAVLPGVTVTLASPALIQAQTVLFASSVSRKEAVGAPTTSCFPQS